MSSVANVALLVLAMLGGYFAVATVYQAASGGNVGRMFGGSTVEILLQVAGAVIALGFALRLMG